MTGPGTQLKQLLAAIGIVSTPSCSCNKMAKEMDEWGCDLCAQNTTIIVAWMKAQAASRKLPFIDAVAKLMVRRAIHKARKEASKNATQENDNGGTV